MAELPAPVGQSVRDLLVAAPADDLLERLALLALDGEIDARAWREIALAGLDRVAEQHLEIDRLHAQLAALREELRRFVVAAVSERRAA